MSRLSPDCVWRRVVIDARQPARARIMARLAAQSQRVREVNVLHEFIFCATIPP